MAPLSRRASIRCTMLMLMLVNFEHTTALGSLLCSWCSLVAIWDFSDLGSS